MHLRFYHDPETGQPHIYRHGVHESEVEDVLTRPLEDRAGSEGSRVATSSAKEERIIMMSKRYPAGWDEARVLRVLEHYESQAEEEAVAEDEAAFEATTDTAMTVPVELVPTVRALIRERKRSA